MSELTQTQFESSDDELPEEISFDVSKRAALKSVKDALESAQREKNLLKEKRRKRQELFLEQKKRKCLPEDLLKEFNTSTEKPTNVTEKPPDSETDETTSETVSKSLPDCYTVTRVKDDSSAKSLQQNAMDFIQSRLYGPGTKRTTNAEFLSLKKKKGPNQGAAVNFANKNLSADAKAKLENSNKRFLLKQKLAPR